MKACKIIICIFIFILGYGCSQNKNDRISFDFEQEIECITLPYTDLLGITMQVIKTDSILLINDFQGDSLIVAYNVNNNQIIRKLISVGNGPNELISPLELYIEKSNLFIFCRRLLSLYTVPLDSLTEKDINLKKNIQLPTEVSRLYPLSDSLFVCSGFFKGRYALLNTQGEIVGEFGEYPNFWSKEVNFPVSARAMFHQAAFVKHPTKAMFSSYSSHVIEIYSFENNRLAPDLIKKIPLGNYSYTYTTGNTLSAKKGNDVEKGIVDIACTSDYIYLVYDLSLNSNQNLDTRIMVIDWQGKPVKALTTKMNITCLFLDDEEMRAYCIVKNPEDTLAYFDLEN